MRSQFEQCVTRVLFVEYIAKPSRVFDEPWVGLPIVDRIEQIHFAGT